jgi:hypothetical protein
MQDEAEIEVGDRSTSPRSIKSAADHDTKSWFVNQSNAHQDSKRRFNQTVPTVVIKFKAAKITKCQARHRESR